LADPKRAKAVRERIVAISKQVSEAYIENGLLLREYKENGYYKEDGYDSFDEAIQGLHDAGQIDYGPRNARNFIKVVEMIDQHGLDAKKVGEIPISKLREIATVQDQKQQQKLLEAANDMTVAEVQAKTRAIRNKADETDPLHPITLMTTQSQREVFERCLKAARRVWSVNEDVPDAAVLIDHLLSDWELGLPAIEAEAIEAEQFASR
jgi:hypothetical protein